MNALDHFLLIATDENGSKLNLSNVQNEGFAGVICLNENFTDVYINCDKVDVYESNLNKNEELLVSAFAEHVQASMKDQIFFIQNILTTQKSLR